jgi:hypothetical protein
MALATYYEAQTRTMLKATGVTILIQVFSSSGGGTVSSLSSEIYSNHFRIPSWNRDLVSGPWVGFLVPLLSF